MSFFEQGLNQLSPQDDVALNNQWRVSQILGMSPFDEAVTSLNRVQIEWIFSMYAKDNPGTFKIEKPVDGALVARKKWADVLAGTALMDYLRSMVPPYRKNDVK